MAGCQKKAYAPSMLAAYCKKHYMYTTSVVFIKTSIAYLKIHTTGLWIIMIAIM